ncbi:MAG: type IV pilus twitching motility protein PilT [Chthoniobacterales bacterium]
MAYSHDLPTLLRSAVQQGASDLHLVVGMPPIMRRHGELLSLYEQKLEAQECRDLILDILTNAQRATLEKNLELDFALQVTEVGRFRGNIHFSRGKMEAAFRHIPNEIPSLGDLGHLPSINKILGMERGLVLVTGITGSGKSTTMASLIQTIADQRKCVVITVEDPIEYILESENSVIKQREVGTDTLSFTEGLRHVLRQDPDVILVGEMRDLETVRAAISAAETGHLVIATLHTIDAPKAIDRIVDAFPAEQQAQIIAQLANSLEAIISQRLLPLASGDGRILVTETLFANNAVRACIREKRWEQLVSIIEIGGTEGMNTIDSSLTTLLNNGQISIEEVAVNARDYNAIVSSAPPPEPKKRKLF